MISFKPSPRQALAIFSMVFGQSDAAREPDMKTLGLKPAERAQLLQHGLIELEKASRGQRASLSDRGWVWAADNLRAKLDQRSPAGKTLSGVLALLDNFLRQHDTQLSEFAWVRVERSSPKLSKTKRRSANASDPSKASGDGKKARGAKSVPSRRRSAADKIAALEQKGATRKKRKAVAPIAARRKISTPNGSTTKSKPTRRAAEPSRRAKTSPASPMKRVVREEAAYTQSLASNNDNAAVMTSNSVAARIRSAALEIASGATRTRVRLSELRSHLTDLPREQVDRELFRLAGQGGLVLYAIDDTNDLDDDDRRAALMVAGNPRHVIYLENKR